MSIYIEDHLPVVKYNGLNTTKAVDFSSATSVALPSGATATSTVLTTPVITSGLTASGSGANDFSASTGTFKTSTGATTIGTGALTVSASSSTFNNAVSINAATNYWRQVTTGGAFATPIVLTSAQSGRVYYVADAAGLDFTLPALSAAEVGVHYRFQVAVTITSNSLRITAASGDLLFGGIIMTDFDTADKIQSFAPDGNDLVYTANGSTSGGKQGTWVEYIAASATAWMVTGISIGDGTIVTPFS